MADYFDIYKYNQSERKEYGKSSYSFHSDGYANDGFVISFYHMITGKELRFKAFITVLNDTYSPNYNPEEVYGRMDPIYSYRGTTRSISLAFKVPAESAGEAYENLAKAQTLIQMQYPAYTNVKNALTIAQAPLIRLKVMNIINDSNNSSQNEESARTLYDSYSSNDDATEGLLGIIDSLTVDQSGLIGDDGIFEKESNTMLPKLMDINLNFKPIHTHGLGWTMGTDGNYVFGKRNVNSEPVSFPYGAAQASPNSVATTATTTIDSNSRAKIETAAAEKSQVTGNPLTTAGEVNSNGNTDTIFINVER